VPATKAEIAGAFPSLSREGFDITSAEDVHYNCIAYACGDTANWWWPTKLNGNYWPGDVPAEETLRAFEALFEKQGYRKCRTAILQRSFERVAIFTNNGVPTHAARQLDNGHWSSKLGRHEDIMHALRGLEQSPYGVVGSLMRRRRPGLKVGLVRRLIEEIVL
jgi:hypothetical protein